MNSLEKNFFSLITNQCGIIKSICCIYYKDLEDQKDAEQDIILQLWKSFPSFRGDSKISTWVYRVSLNTILSKRNKEKRKRNNEVVLDPNQIKNLYSINSDDDIQLLKQLINTLDELDKAIAVLHLEGYKNNEIGDLLEKSPTNISTRLNRIRKKLKSKYKLYNNEIR